MAITKIGETISSEEFNKKYGVGTTISAEEFNKKYEMNTSIPDQELITSKIGIMAKTLKSMPASTWNFAKRVITALNPLTTFKTISQIPTEFKGLQKEAGGTKKALELTTKEIPSTLYKGLVPKATQQIIKGDYIGAANTIATDPVGEILPYLMLAKYGFDKMGKGAEFDKAIQTIASPITKPTSFVAQKIGQFIGKTGATTLGLTTGKGITSIEEAYKRSPEYQASIKGKTTPQGVVDIAKDAIENIKEQRRIEYVSKLEQIPTKGNLDFSDIQAQLNTQLKRFRIGIDEKGRLDFSKSSIRNDGAAVNDITTIYEDISGWKDFSPRGLDVLKQGISDLYSPTARSRAFVEATQKVISDTLKSQVPEYSKLTESYKQYSDLLDEMKGLSLGGKANLDTIFSKLTSAIKGNNAMKQALIQELQTQGQKNIMGAIAGIEMKQWTGGRLTTGAALGNIPYAGFQISDLLVLASTSPRIVSAFVSALGFTTTQISKFSNLLNTYRDLYGIGIPKIQEKK